MSDPEDPPSPSSPVPLEESAEDLYENAPCGYLSALPGGTIVKVNQTFLTWTGYRREDLAGRKRFYELLTAGGRIFHETHYAPLLRMQGAVRELALDIVCADGRRLPVLINSVLRKDGDGQPLVVRTTIFNATDRKEYERELLRERQRAEQASKTKSDFLAMISHDIRTPLNAIVGVSHLLRQTELSPPQQKLVRILGSSSENLMNLVNQILDFGRIEAGKMSLEERPVDLRQLVGEIGDRFRLRAQEKRIALRLEVDERVPQDVVGDPVKLDQVLTNLVGNAVKFTSEGSVTLALEVRAAGPEAVSIEFRVSDTGIGIAPDRLAHIFDDFTQANYDIGLKYGGTGLGLSISRKLVEMYGSRIHVESELGQGTTFSFELRLKTVKDAIVPGVVEAASGLEGLKVLVADDNEVNVFVLTGLLQDWGVEFDVVSDGRQAVEHVRARHYDLVLLDLRMPELDGYAAAREIRALPGERFAKLPLFAVSASTRMGLPHEIDAAGFNEFVGKPISPDILLGKMRRYVPG
ncbi:MAG TPA: ATP-binding protein, partial [Thermoanaerobaculia bacterium]|nr:ATP-binding protein [Thermoanaerobaculia bacterium]